MIKIFDSKKVSLDEILKRETDQQEDVGQDVLAILKDVKARGDVAVRQYSEWFDGVALLDYKVSAKEIKDAQKEVGEDFIEILKEAAENLYAFHKRQVRQGFAMADKPGVIMGQRILPLDKVGIYVPGGTAPYPSTVLMDAIPAKIAGVNRIIMATPPNGDGKVNPAVLAAAAIAGVTDIYKMGGAQAIAALSYGTETVPKVDKVVGPGNIYVATAKQLVYGQVDIDMIAGPSDILVIADDTANPVAVAADMLGQAEHDKMATAVLITTSESLAKMVQTQLEQQVRTLLRQEIACASISENGRIILASTIEEAVEISNKIAPEHLELCVEDPFSFLPLVKNAGSIFLGHYTPEALGDYFAGPNHTLPTMGTARFYSPLSVDDFIKKSSYLYYSKEALGKVSDKVQAFANKEKLTAHAKSVAVRTKM